MSAAAHLTAREWVRLLLGPNAEGTALVAYTASAFDASYDDNGNTGVSVVAGLMGTSDAWDAVRAEWSAAVDWWRLPPDKGFHLTELPRLVGHERERMCAMYFARIIGRSALTLRCGVVLNADWHAVQHPAEYLRVHKRPHFMALSMLLDAIKLETQLAKQKDPIALIIDNDYGTAEHTAAIFSAWCERTGTPETDFAPVLLPRPGSVERQCADCAAGAIRFDDVTLTLLTGVQASRANPKREMISALTNGRGWGGALWSKRIAIAHEEEIKLRERGVLPEQRPS